MGDAFIAFEPGPFLPNQKMPPCYNIEGIRDEEGVFYYWWRGDGEGPYADPVEFGENRPNKFAARRDAWEHYNKRKED
jgi:hypothetical protein